MVQRAMPVGGCPNWPQGGADGAGHVREQLVLDLVVEAAEEDVDNAAAAHVAGGQHLASQEVQLPAMSLSSILYLPPQRLMPAGPGDGGGR